MNKDEIIKRAESDGTKSGKAMFYRDYSLSKSYHDDMVNLKRYYPEYAREIQETYDRAYKAEYASYKRPPAW